jgi:uncharacterized protein YjbI with pentapeptide repeats
MTEVTNRNDPTLSHRGLTLALLIVLGGVAVLFSARALVGVSQFPARQAADLRRQIDTDTSLSLEKRVQLQTALIAYETDSRIKIWTAIVQAAGGAALLLGLVFTARNLRATQDKLDIDRQGQLTNRFIQATNQLGAELKGGEHNVEVRLGGIYALSRISQDWPRDYWPIAEILTAYVRHNAVWDETRTVAQHPRTDIQAILTVLGHHAPPGGFTPQNKLDLRFADLRGLEFYNANLEWTDFHGAHLENAVMWGAVLRHAKLEKAHLAGANLRGVKLEGATLDGADVTGALFDGDTVWPAGFDARARGATLVA